MIQAFPASVRALSLVALAALISIPAAATAGATEPSAERMENIRLAQRTARTPAPRKEKAPTKTEKSKADNDKTVSKEKAVDGDDAPKEKLSGPDIEKLTQRENAHHAARLAKLDRLAEIAKEKSNEKLAERVTKLKDKETRRHTKRMAHLTKKAEKVKKGEEVFESRADRKAKERGKKRRKKWKEMGIEPGDDDGDDDDDDDEKGKGRKGKGKKGDRNDDDDDDDEAKGKKNGKAGDKGKAKKAEKAKGKSSVNAKSKGKSKGAEGRDRKGRSKRKGRSR